MNLNKDYYSTLGLSPTAADKEIKNAFRRLASTCHPDRHPGDKQMEERFKDLSEAYSILSSAESRARYDRRRAINKRTPFKTAKTSSQTGSAGNQNKTASYNKTKSPPRGPAGCPFTTTQKPYYGPETTKASLAQKAKPKNWWRKVKNFMVDFAEDLGFLKEIEDTTGNLNYKLAITPDEAAQGTEVKFQYKPNGQPKELLIKVPPGVKNNTLLRLSGQGEINHGAKKGDLILTVIIINK